MVTAFLRSSTARTSGCGGPRDSVSEGAAATGGAPEGRQGALRPRFFLVFRVFRVFFMVLEALRAGGAVASPSRSSEAVSEGLQREARSEKRSQPVLVATTPSRTRPPTRPSSSATLTTTSRCAAAPPIADGAHLTGPARAPLRGPAPIAHMSPHQPMRPTTRRAQPSCSAVPRARARNSQPWLVSPGSTCPLWCTGVAVAHPPPADAWPAWPPATPVTRRPTTTSS